MELTKKDRIFLINQYEILKQIEPENSDHYDNLIEILRGGYQNLYGDVDIGISEDMPIEDGQFVFDILDMYRAVEHYKRLNPNDTEVSKHVWGHFQGFDGNNEATFRGFTLFLFMKYNRFTEQAIYQNSTDNFNTHGPTLGKYKCMIEKWKALGNKLETHEAIMLVLNAE